MTSGSRDGLACANTNSSRRLRVSPEKTTVAKPEGCSHDLHWMRPVLARVKIFCVMCTLLDESTTKCTGHKVWKEDDFKGPRCNSPVGSVGSIFIVIDDADRLPAGGDSIPRWSASKPQVVTRRKAKGAGQKKNGR